MIEENVGVGREQTEAVAGAKGEPQGAASVGGASAVLGKFKDVDALAKAYESLQAEFTRRSQKLRALEKEAENLHRQGESSGAEKLRKAAKLRREASRKFDAFVAENYSATAGRPDSAPTRIVEEAKGNGDGAVGEQVELGGAVVGAVDGVGGAVVGAVGATCVVDGEGEDMAEVVEAASVAEGTLAKSAIEGSDKERVKEVAGGEVLTTAPRSGMDGEGGVEASAVGYGSAFSSAVTREGAPVSSEDLYEQASANEVVRLRIVGEYLASLGKAGAPLTGGGAGVAVTPPLRAKTVGQAGNMALQYFRKPTVD